jgi:hypothetical protein
MTPHGLVDSACVFEVPMGAVVDEKGDVMMNGVAVDHHDPCTPEQMGFQDQGATTSVSPPGIGHAWIAWTSATAQPIDGLAFYNDLSGYWTVPNDPIYQCLGVLCYEPAPIIYFFPAFQSSTEIVQPVLSWGYNGNYGGPWWSLSSWYWSSSAAFYSPPIGANQGDTIFGVISILASNEYQITTNNITQGGHYTYLNTYFYHPMTTVNGGAMEVYNVYLCTSYPTSSPVEFSDLSIFQAGPLWNSYNLVNPSWTVEIDTSANPQCGYSVSGGENTGNVSFAKIGYYD